VTLPAERTLGLVECFHAVLNQCPYGPARSIAEHGLAAIEREGSKAMGEQAFLLRTAIRGWQGARADQVKRSLDAFLASPSPAATER
jgi:hypothetical protein